MNKSDKTAIKEVIEHILQFRTKEIWDNENAKTSTYDWEEKDRLNKITTEKYDKPLIKLNNLLKREEQYKEVLDIEAEMRKIQAKKYITTDEMVEIYNISISSQRDYRGRLNDPLPFNQKKFRGKITYTVEDIEKWLKNQGK
ncbi:hypothetical protein [Sulfurimonas sp.]